MDIFPKKLIKTRRDKLSNEVQLNFLKRLNRLLSNGYPLLPALEIIKWDKQMIRPAEQIINSLKNGSTVDQAFDIAAFHGTIIGYLYFVRTNGDLQGSIEKCVEMFNHRMNYMKKFQQIARYPLILLFIFAILLYFIKQSVLPSFLDLFQTSTEASSTVTFSIIVIELLGTLGVVLGVLFISGILLWHLMKHKISIEKQIKFCDAIPIYRRFLKLQTSFLFATHFSTLLKTGMSFKEILHHMANQKKLPIISYYSKLMTEELTQGFHITSLLSQFNFLERQLVTIFQKNSDNYILEKDLIIYAELLTEEIQRKIVKSITYIQPVFFVVLASFIIFIYISLMWPMFQLIKTI